MKNIIFLFVCVLASMLYSIGQPYPLYIIAEDNKGRIDTVKFGLRTDATLGIDTLLKEKNIYLMPFDTLDIRSIQRTSSDYRCLQTLFTNEPIFSEENLDSKIDFRPDITGSSIPFNSIYYNFEFNVYGLEYPIKIYGDFENAGGYIFSYIALYNTNCDLINYKELKSTSPTEAIFTLDSPDLHTLSVHLEFETGINQLNKVATWRLFPNPVGNQLKIVEIPNDNSHLQIFNLKGEVLYSTHLNSENIKVDISSITKGNYIVKITNLQNHSYSSKLFVKMK